MKTPMKKLFEEFKALSESSRFAGDASSANLIDFLCEREDVAIAEELEYINSNTLKNQALREIIALAKIYPDDVVFATEVREVVLRIKKYETAIELAKHHVRTSSKPMTISEQLKSQGFAHNTTKEENTNE